MSTFYQDIKRWWKSKTIAFGGQLVVVGQVVDHLQATGNQWADKLGDWGGMVITGIGVVAIWLRFKTKGPVAVRRPKVDETDEAGA